MKYDHVILGVHIMDRLTQVAEVQRLLTEYGNSIKTRLGLHDVEHYPAPNGLLLLEMFGEEHRADELSSKLNAIEGVEVKKMVFAHD